MSDLISRSALIEALNKYVQLVYDCDGIDDGNVVEYQQLHEDKTSYIIQGFSEAFEILQEQPIAYDVDAVVKEALQLLDKLLHICALEDVDKIYDFRGCIENTIRKGGVNDK